MNNRAYKLVIFMMTALLVYITCSGYHTYAAIPKLDQIRVALFLDTDKYKSSIPTVTLYASQGFDVGNRSPQDVKAWFSVGAQQKTRFSLDRYMVQLMETSDYSAAQALYKKLAGSVDKPYIFTRSRAGKTLYQVYAGPYLTDADASKARDKQAADPSLIPLLKTSSPVVTGPLHWNAGTYAQESDALASMQTIAQSGLDPFIVVNQSQDGSVKYNVWLGEAVDQVQLDAFKAQALKLMPTLDLQPVNTSLPYLLRREDVSLGDSANPILHYVFNPQGQKVWVSSAQPGIRVYERSDRSYRGSMEISQFSNKLALINELPFEQYLYSVVSSEMGGSWPIEALKAQAVAARTYALTQGLKYQIAHVTDTTLEQAYNGMGNESPAPTSAVQATANEVLTNSAGLITPFYSSNAGGVSADAVEVWGKPLSYIQSVPSPDDNAQASKMMWLHIVLANGHVGYIREDLAKKTGINNSAGFAIYEVIVDGTNVRKAPDTNNSSNPPIDKVNKGDRVTVFEQDIESNDYSWIRGPYDAGDLLSTMNAKLAVPLNITALQTLEVSQKGPSARVTEIKANGLKVNVSSPDAYRSVLNGLPSTKFAIEEMGRYTVLGANGTSVNITQSNGAMFTLSGSKQTLPMNDDQMFVMDGNKDARVLTSKPQFRFKGFGFGHGIGMSQWGAKGFADQGYDYLKILKYYYNNVSIAKG